MRLHPLGVSVSSLHNDQRLPEFSFLGGWAYSEDHPRTCKWLITMVKKSCKYGCGTPSKWPLKMAEIHGVIRMILPSSFHLWAPLLKFILPLPDSLPAVRTWHIPNERLRGRHAPATTATDLGNVSRSPRGE